MKHRVIRDCFGFRNQYWEKGAEVHIEKGEKVPEHFEPVGANASESSSEPKAQTPDAAAERKPKPKA